MLRHHRLQFQGRARFSGCCSGARFPHEWTLNREEMILISWGNKKAIHLPLFKEELILGVGR